MVVIATPIGTASATDLQSSTRLNVHTPEIASAFDESLLQKKRAARIRQNTLSYLQPTLVDNIGNPINLYAYSLEEGLAEPETETITEVVAVDSSSSSVISSSSTDLTTATVNVRFREAALVDPTTYTMVATVLTPDEGLIRFAVPDEVSEATGIYLVEAGIVDSGSNLLYTNEFYLYNEHSAWHDEGDTTKGPPQISDLRLSLRDNDPYENELIEDFDFGLVELAFAATRVVDYWNTQPPHIAPARYSTRNFPHREIWIEGVHLFLFELAEEHYRRNHLKHNAGGTSTDDKNRHREYRGAMMDRFARFRKLVIHKKSEINMARGFGSFSGRYPF